MKVKWRLTVAAATLAILTALACSTTDNAAESSPSNDGRSVDRTPVPRSQVGTAFGELLSSGLSVADVTEKALPSVVHIINAGFGTGTGFIIQEDGLVVTNTHVVGGNNRVTVRLVTGDEYPGNVTQRHPDLDLAYIEIDSAQSFTPIAKHSSWLNL